MKLSNIQRNLEDLIQKLSSAEKRYQEISLAISDTDLKDILRQISSQRKDMRQALQVKLQAIGGSLPSTSNLKTAVDNIFLDIKLNHIDWSTEAVVSEIEKGAGDIVQDYQRTITGIKYHPDIKQILIRQKNIIQEELLLFKELAA